MELHSSAGMRPGRWTREATRQREHGAAGAHWAADAVQGVRVQEVEPDAPRLPQQRLLQAERRLLVLARLQAPSHGAHVRACDLQGVELAPADSQALMPGRQNAALVHLHVTPA